MRLLLAVLIAPFIILLTPSTANAEEGCLLNALGIKVCGTLLGQPLPEVVTVTVRPEPIRLPPVTVTLPPRPPRTVEVPVPGPTRTVGIPGPTKTVTARPNNPGPSAAPTVTATVTPQPAGQTPSASATLPSAPEKPKTVVETRTKTETIVRTVIVGTLAAIILAALGCLALWLGYVLGYKGAERKEARSLRGMLDTIKAGRKTTS